MISSPRASLGLAASFFGIALLFPTTAAAAGYNREVEQFLTAADSANAEKLKELSRYNPGLINARGETGFTALMVAAVNSRLEAAKYLIGRGAEVNAGAREGDMTPLFYGISNIEMVRLLLSHGADAKARTKTGSTPLSVAAKLGSPQIVELLISKGAVVNSFDEYGQTPLDMTGPRQSSLDRASRDAIAAILRKHGAVSGDDILAAIEKSDVEAVRKLIKLGPTIVQAGTLTPDGSALARAVRGGNAAIVRLLLESGARVKDWDTKSRTPLHAAAGTGNVEIVDLLLARGAEHAPALRRIGGPHRSRSRLDRRGSWYQRAPEWRAVPARSRQEQRNEGPAQFPRGSRHACPELILPTTSRN